jgi:hypothetical protein
VSVLLFFLSATFWFGAKTEVHRPSFEDFPLGKPPSIIRAPIRLELRAEQMFKTRLTEASKKDPNFAGSLRSVGWGCGSNCAAGAFIDLESGLVYRQPLAPGTSGWDRWVFKDGFFEGAGAWGRLDSRLLIIRCGMTWLERIDRIVPDTYYFLWEGDHFRRLLKVAADESELPSNAARLI